MKIWATRWWTYTFLGSNNDHSWDFHFIIRKRTRSNLFDAPDSLIAKLKSIHCTKDDCQSKDGGNIFLAPFLCTCTCTFTFTFSSSFDDLHFELSTFLYVERLSFTVQWWFGKYNEKKVWKVKYSVVLETFRKKTLERESLDSKTLRRYTPW